MENMILQRGRYKITDNIREEADFSTFRLTDCLLGLSLYGEKLPMSSFALWFELKRAIQIRTTLPGDFFPTVNTFFLEHSSVFFLYNRLPEYNLEELQQKKIPANRIQIASNIINALDILQQHKMIHGNLRPGNIFFSENGHINLLSMSLKTIPHGTGLFLPPHPVYTAPETGRNINSANTASDIYALGGILSFLLAPEQQSSPAESHPDLPVLQRELIRKCRATVGSERYSDFSIISKHLTEAAREPAPEQIISPPPAKKSKQPPQKTALPAETDNTVQDSAAALVDRLHLAHKKNQHQRQIAILIEIGKCTDIKPPDIDYIRSLLGQCTDFFVLATVIKTIGKISPEKEWNSLSRFLKHSDSRVAANTVEALSFQEEPRLKSFLEGLLHEETLQNEGRTRVLCAGIPYLKKHHPEAAIEAMRLLSIGNQEAVSTYAFLLSKWEKSEPLLHKYTLQLLKTDIRIEVAEACMSYIEKHYDEDCLHRLLMITGTMTDSARKKLITDFLNKIKPA